MADEKIVMTAEEAELIYRNQYEDRSHGSKHFNIAAYSSDQFGSYCHHHNEHELIYVPYGAVHVLIANEFISIKAGEAAFVPRNTIHHIDYDICMRDKKSKYYAVLFPDDFWGTDVCGAFFKKYVFNVHISLSEKSRESVVEIYNLLESKPHGHEFLVKGLLGIVISELISTNQYTEKKTPRTQTNPDIIITLIDYIDNNYKKKISIDELAQLVGFSPNYTSRLFRKYCNMSIVEFINGVRVNNVRDELSYTNKKITDIAVENGFTNIGYFNKVFMKHFNCTPMQYRRENKPKT